MYNEEVIRWWNMVQNMAAYVICLVAQWYFIERRPRKRKITYSMSSEREQNRDKKMSRIIDSETAMFNDSNNEIDPAMSQFPIRSPRSYGDDETDMMPPSASGHVSSPHDPVGGNKKSKKSANKERKVGEGIKDAIEKVADAIRTSNELLAKETLISPDETYKLPVDLEFQLPCSVWGNEKSKQSPDKEREFGEGIKDAIEKVADAIRISSERLASALLAKKDPMSPNETISS